MGFLLFRMHMKVDAGSAIFFKRGGETGVLCIKDCGVTFARDVASFQLTVGVRLTSNTVIVRPENLELVPHVFLKRYRSGGGVRMYDPHRQDHKDAVQARSGAFPADIFVVAVPYNHRNQSTFTDISGTLHPNLQVSNTNGLMYATAQEYSKIWGWTPNEFAVAGCRDRQMQGSQLSVCAQSSHFRFNPSSQQCDLLVPGVCPMGPRADAHNWRIVLGGEMLGYSGSGFEGSRPSPLTFSQAY